MGLVLSGAFGAQGAQGALRQIELRAIDEQERAKAAVQQEFLNQIALRKITEDELTGGVNRTHVGRGDARADAAEGRAAEEYGTRRNVLQGLTPIQQQQVYSGLDFSDLANPDQMRARGASEGAAAGASDIGRFNGGGRDVFAGQDNIRTGNELRLIGARSAAELEQARQRAAMTPPATGGSSVADDYKAERSKRVTDSVDELIGEVSPWTTGLGSLLSYIPATAAKDFDAKLNTLKGNIAFNELTEMRAASKTGGALGAVSDKEIKLLESALGALDTKQSPGQFKKQLQQIKDSVERWNAAKSGGGSAAGPKKLSAEELIRKYGG